MSASARCLSTTEQPIDADLRRPKSCAQLLPSYVRIRKNVYLGARPSEIGDCGELSSEGTLEHVRMVHFGAHGLLAIEIVEFAWLSASPLFCFPRPTLRRPMTMGY